MIDPLACYIFIGRSGCGKGTQAKLLIEYLKQYHPDRSVLYLETGQGFRHFVKQDNHTATLADRVIRESDHLPPSFLAISFWSNVLISEFTGRQDLVFDGSPRSLSEARVLNGALDFYGFGKRYVLNLDLSPETARARLKARGRSDDKTEAEVDRRLRWFLSEVKPALDWYQEHENYEVLTVDGSRDIDAIHEEIISKL